MAIHAKRKSLPLAALRYSHRINRRQAREIQESTRPKPPILVIESPLSLPTRAGARKHTTYQILDGHHRVSALRRAGATHVTAFVIPRSAYLTYADRLGWWNDMRYRTVGCQDLDTVTYVQLQGKRRRYDGVRGNRAGRSILAQWPQDGSWRGKFIP